MIIKTNKQVILHCFSQKLLNPLKGKEIIFTLIARFRKVYWEFLFFKWIRLFFERGIRTANFAIKKTLKFIDANRKGQITV